MGTGKDQPRMLPGLLVVVAGPELGVVYSVGVDDIVIGRGAKAEVQVQGDGISRMHARLARDGRGAVTVLDLGSANGTFVNDERVDFVALQSGDRLRIGREVEFQFRYEVPDDRDTLDLGTNNAAASVENNLATAMRNLGRMHLSAREFRQALHAFERARRQIERRAEPNRGDLAGVLVETAECWLGLNKLEEAERLATDALRHLEGLGAKASELASARFVLARAIASADPHRARRLAEEALEGPDANSTLADKVRTWLARSVP
jgi:pSer/pThr/pTyr-binding forkhead associated (FHA) protein